MSCIGDPITADQPRQQAAAPNAGGNEVVKEPAFRSRCQEFHMAKRP